MSGSAGAAPRTVAPLAIDGPAAPPRSNGELVFAEPWESRAFGMAVSLHESGVFEWPEFQATLIARIAAWERSHAEGECWSYYEHWLGALQDVLVSEGAVFTDEITTRARQLGGRLAGHDHREHPEPAHLNEHARRGAARAPRRRRRRP